MFNFSRKIYLFLAAIAIFQLSFPQYSSAGNRVVFLVGDQEILARKNLPELIILDGRPNFRLGRLPAIINRQPRRVVKVAVTAYSSTIDQCDSSPFITASGKRVKSGIIAGNFLPFGTKVKLPEFDSEKIFTVEDRMNPRYYYRLDIWMPSRQEAKAFGVKYLTAEIY